MAAAAAALILIAGSSVGRILGHDSGTARPGVAGAEVLQLPAGSVFHGRWTARPDQSPGPARFVVALWDQLERRADRSDDAPRLVWEPLALDVPDSDPAINQNPDAPELDAFMGSEPPLLDTDRRLSDQARAHTLQAAVQAARFVTDGFDPSTHADATQQRLNQAAAWLRYAATTLGLLDPPPRTPATSPRDTDDEQPPRTHEHAGDPDPNGPEGIDAPSADAPNDPSGDPTPAQAAAAHRQIAAALVRLYLRAWVRHADQLAGRDFAVDPDSPARPPGLGGGGPGRAGADEDQPWGWGARHRLIARAPEVAAAYGSWLALQVDRQLAGVQRRERVAGELRRSLRDRREAYQEHVADAAEEIGRLERRIARRQQRGENDHDRAGSGAGTGIQELQEALEVAAVRYRVGERSIRAQVVALMTAPGSPVALATTDYVATEARAFVLVRRMRTAALALELESIGGSAEVEADRSRRPVEADGSDPSDPEAAGARVVLWRIRLSPIEVAGVVDGELLPENAARELFNLRALGRAGAGANAIERAVLLRVNRWRAQLGLVRLVHARSLTAAAVSYARLAVREGAIAHDLDGATPLARARDAGFAGASVGEILHQSARLLDPVAAVDEIFRAIAGSPAHALEAVRPTFTNVGLARRGVMLCLLVGSAR